ncbi:MAG: helix-turn-helix transcriptional regulator [Dehalococcoidales bacterium]|nr:helix-turn-helix transcriptional regulator [Dehalococcoidales bacterium]
MYNKFKTQPTIETNQKDINMTTMSMGEKLALLRIRKKINKKQLAEMTGLHWTSISKYERNEAVPYADGLKKLATVLEVPTDYLLFDDHEIDSTIRDHELQSLAAQVDRLPDKDKEFIKDTIKNYLKKNAA